MENAIAIGLLPDIPEKGYRFIGNGSLKGALLALTDEEKRKEADRIAAKATYIDLSTDKGFGKEYMDALFLPHKDQTRFPNVEKNALDLDLQRHPRLQFRNRRPKLVFHRLLDD